MVKNIAVLPGDGIGPEITSEAVKILDSIQKKFGYHFNFEYGLIGAAAINEKRDPFPLDTLKLCKDSDAILFGAIGDPKFDDNPEFKIRPEQGLLKMRSELELYANYRPVISFQNLFSMSPLKDNRLKDIDFIIVRELTGGIYYGEPRGRSEDGKKAFDSCIYTIDEIERIAKNAFELAITRNKKITLVDKANVLATSRLWREQVKRMEKEYPEIEVNYLYVDNAAMQIIQNPSQFDVILTDNMFGDILSDEASVITGSLGLLPSASIGLHTSVYEPIHGSYPQAAGKNIANPVATILSTAMMMDHSFNKPEAGKVIRKAVNLSLENKMGTPDLHFDKPKTTSYLGSWLADKILTLN